MATEYQKVVVKGTFLNQEIRNIFYGLWDDPLGIDDPNQLILSYLADVYNPILQYMSSGLSFTSYELYKWVPQDWVLRGTQVLTLVGLNMADPLPLQIAAVIIGKVVGHRGFGRKFFAGFCEDAQEQGEWGSSVLDALASSALAYITRQDGVGFTWTPGIWSNLKAWYPFISGLVDALAGTQRRRKPGVGR